MTNTVQADAIDKNMRRNLKKQESSPCGMIRGSRIKGFFGKRGKSEEDELRIDSEGKGKEKQKDVCASLNSPTRTTTRLNRENLSPRSTKTITGEREECKSYFVDVVNAVQNIENTRPCVECQERKSTKEFAGNDSSLCIECMKDFESEEQESIIDERTKLCDEISWHLGGMPKTLKEYNSKVENVMNMLHMGEWFYEELTSFEILKSKAGSKIRSPFVIPIIQMKLAMLLNERKNILEPIHQTDIQIESDDICLYIKLPEGNTMNSIEIAYFRNTL
jgi:hypothetical protein